jgi:hypothetical protein
LLPIRKLCADRRPAFRRLKRTRGLPEDRTIARVFSNPALKRAVAAANNGPGAPHARPEQDNGIDRLCHSHHFVMKRGCRINDRVEPFLKSSVENWRVLRLRNLHCGPLGLYIVAAWLSSPFGIDSATNAMLS